MTDNPLKQLEALGQSIWYDYIRRDLLTSGELARMIDEDGLRGMTTNPSIFAAAVAEGDLYDADIRAAGPGASTMGAYEAIAMADVRAAAEAFLPVFERTGGVDGYVSLEVSPELAYDAEATASEARRLWAAVGRDNLMIKIPGTREGLPAIEACLADGINVNVTLLFSVPRYREVMEAYLRAMERRLDAGLPLDDMASVASFFVSRVDSLVDKRLEAMLAESTAGGEAAARIERSLHRLGVANARLAYEAFEEVFAGPRFEALAAAGARAQRPLWASTSTKDARLSDVLYVDELVAPHSVNTIPPQTYAAYRDHGEPAVRIRDDLEGARRAMADLEALGLPFAEVAQTLEEEGVKKFQVAFDELLATIEAKRGAVRWGC